MTRSLLARHGYECPYGNLLGKSAQQWLDEVKLEGYAAQMLAVLRRLLAVIQEKVEDFEHLVDEAAAGHSVAERLRSIPGIGPFLGLSLAVEIGDINRFPSPTHLRGYSGLVPAVTQSGDKDARGPLTKTGNRWLRYAAVQAAQRMSQMRNPDPRMKRTFPSVSFRHGYNPGKIAAARRLLDMIYHLLKREEDYQAPVAATAVRQA